MAATGKADVRRVTRKLLARAEALLDDPDGYLSTADLGRLASMVEDAAAVLGVKPKLDEEEQRGKIAVLRRRAGEDEEHEGTVEVSFSRDAFDASL